MSAAKNFFGKVALKLQNLRERGIQHVARDPWLFSTLVAVVRNNVIPLGSRGAGDKSHDRLIRNLPITRSYHHTAYAVYPGSRNGISQRIFETYQSSLFFLVPAPLIVLFNVRG
jgi:hypothetical protein